MPNRESIKSVLMSAVSKELENVGDRLDFYGISYPEVKTLWESSDSLSLDDALCLIDPDSDEDMLYGDLALLYGIGWEFVWGKEPPEVVSILREELKEKVSLGYEVNKLEHLWLNLMLIDTDIF